MALVEPPVPPDREPAAPRRCEGDLCGADGPGQDRGVQHPQVQALLSLEQLAAGPSLGLTGRGQVDVDPAREQVVGVPGRLAVAEQHQIEHGCDGMRAQSEAGKAARNCGMAIALTSPARPDAGAGPR